VWPLLAAAAGPMVLIGAGLMFYNALRFDNPLEFGQRYQLPLTVHQQFRLRYLWFNFRVGFLEPARWTGRFPFVDNIVAPATPAGYGNLEEAYGVLTNLPLLWLALAAPLAWRNRTEEAGSKLRWFCGVLALLFGMCALPIVLHDSVCMRYEMEYASPLLLLAAVGVFGLERALAGRPAWRRAARCGWGLLLAFTVAFNLFASYKSNADDRQNFGYALLETGRLDEAITQFQKTLQMRPDGETAHNNLGVAFHRAGRLDEATAEYDRVLQLDPDSDIAHDDLGDLLMKEGRTDEAIVHYQKAVQLKPHIALTRRNLGDALLKKGRLDEALAQYQEAVQLKPDYTDAHSELGIIFAREGRMDEALAHFQKAVELKPDAADTRQNLANALAQKGRLDEAILQYQEALQIKPDSTEAQIGLGNALVLKGKVEEAIAQLQKALQLKPADPSIENPLAWLLITAPQRSLRNGAKALELARHSNLLTGGENPVILHTLAAACAETGRFSEAVETAQHALRLAEAQSNTALAGALQSELKLYQTNSPLHGP